MSISGFLFVLFLVPLLNAHLCVIWPPQRGGWNPNGAPFGDDHCFGPQAPCGNRPAGTPISLYTDTVVYVEFQQNLNHYSPGFPGFLEVSYATGSNPANDTDFYALALVPDLWLHLQASETNFSVPILVPNRACTACTLQVKYHPNKPTEPIFHNCADVSFVVNPNTLPKRIFAFVSAEPTDMYLSALVEVLPGGRLSETGLEIHYFKRQIVLNQFLTNGVLTYIPVNDSLYFIGDSLDVFVNPQGAGANTLYSYSLSTGEFTPVASNLMRTGIQWVALFPGGDGFLYGVQQTEIGEDYAFTVSQITFDGVAKDIATSKTDDTFVNFFWADIDPVNSIIYVLSGDENSLFTLDVTLYSFNLKTAAVTAVQVSNTDFTVSNLHVDPQTGTIYSITPGLYDKLAWTIVVINPQTGAVTTKSSIANSSQWPRFYGGGVYNGLAGSQVLHTFKNDAGATTLTSIDINSGNILYMTDIDLGVNSRRQINSIIAI